MLSMLLFLVSILAPGFLTASFFYPRHISGRQLLGLAYGAGSAIVTCELFLYFVVLRLHFSPGLFWFFALQSAVALAAFRRRFPWQDRLSVELGKIKAWNWLLGALIALALFAGLVQALAKPPVAFDSVAFWALRGEMLLADGQVNFTLGTPTYLSALSHANYPWHLSLMEYWARALGNGGGAVNIIAWLYFASLVLLALDFCLKRLGATRGLLLVLFLCSQPLIFYHASNNYADLIVGYYAAAGFAFFLEWLDDRRLPLLLLAAALTGWTFSVKNYGSFYIIAFAIGLGLAWILKMWRPTWRAWSLTAAALLLPILPIALFKAFHRLNLRNSDAAWTWQPQALASFRQALFIDNNWNIWWIVLAAVFIAAIPRMRRHKKLIIPWAMFASLVGILLLIFTLTENYQWALDQTALARSFIPLMPLSLLAAAYSLEYGLKK